MRCHPSPVSLEPNSQVREHTLVRVRGNRRERRGQHRDLVPAPCPPNRACAASRTRDWLRPMKHVQRQRAPRLAEAVKSPRGLGVSLSPSSSDHREPVLQLPLRPDSQ